MPVETRRMDETHGRRVVLVRGVRVFGWRGLGLGTKGLGDHPHIFTSDFLYQPDSVTHSCNITSAFDMDSSLDSWRGRDGNPHCRTLRGVTRGSQFGCRTGRSSR